jgi:hypothetical protein
MNKKVLWGLGIGLLGALLVKDGIKKDNSKDKKKVSNTKKKRILNDKKTKGEKNMEDFNQIAIKDTKDFTDIICNTISEKEAYNTLDLVKSSLNSDGNILAISEYSKPPLNKIYYELIKLYRDDDTEKNVIDTPLSFNVETANLFDMDMVTVRYGSIFYISLDDLDKITSMFISEWYKISDGDNIIVEHNLNSNNIDVKFIDLYDLGEEYDVTDDETLTYEIISPNSVSFKYNEVYNKLKLFITKK